MATAFATAAAAACGATCRSCAAIDEHIGSAVTHWDAHAPGDGWHEHELSVVGTYWNCCTGVDHCCCCWGCPTWCGGACIEGCMNICMEGPPCAPCIMGQDPGGAFV